MSEARKRVMDPNSAMDFPHLEPELWILWVANGYAWPDARRQMSYLSRHNRSFMGVNAMGKIQTGTPGFALFTGDHDEAATFKTEAEARAFLAENEARRPHPYGVKITTVKELIDSKYNGGEPLL